MAFFGTFYLTKGFGKTIKGNETAHPACWMYKKKITENSVDLSIDFYRKNQFCKRGIPDIKKTKGIYQVSIWSKDVFVFAEHQENATKTWIRI